MPVNSFMEMNFNLPSEDPMIDDHFENVFGNALISMDSLDNDFDIDHLMNIPFPTL